jgi:hypothetical protein
MDGLNGIRLNSIRTWTFIRSNLDPEDPFCEFNRKKDD